MASQERVEASVHARLCCAGESLDWMIRGSSIVGAITLKTTASVEQLPPVGDEHIIYLRSNTPFPSKTQWSWDDPDRPTNSYLRYAESAVDLVGRNVESPCSFEVTIESDIPVNAGVSSSAAVTLATTAATAAFFGLRPSVADLCEMAYMVEHDILKTGAGRMDPYACGMGGLLHLNSGTNPVSVEQYDFPDTLGIVLADTLTPHETRSFISSKRLRFQQGDRDIYHYIDETERHVEHMRQLMPDFGPNREEIGEIMTRLHGLLRNNVRCSTDALDICVDTAIKNGALGAKLTGSGNGGCMFALVEKEHEEQISLALHNLPVRVYETCIVMQGLSVQPYFP